MGDGVAMSDSGTYTPEVIARRLKVAEAMLGDAPPVQHWAQGLNELAKGYVGGRIFNKAEESERQGMQAQYAQLAALLGGGTPAGGGGGNPAPVVASPTGPSPQAPPPLTPPAPREGGDTSPIVPNVVPTIPVKPVQQATEGILSPTDQAMADARTQLAAGMRNNGLASAGPALPPPGALPPAAAQPPPAPMTPAAPPIAAVPLTGLPPPSAGNADAKAKIAAMLQDPNPYVRRQGAQLATAMLPTILKKDEWRPVAGPGGVLMQQNAGSGELKAHPGANDYNIQKMDDGTMVAVNKHNPSDYHVVTPAGVRENQISYAGAKKQAETKGEAVGKIEADLPNALEKSEFLLDTIKNVENHPGLPGGTGLTGIARRRFPGSETYNFGVAADQLKGKTFLEAYAGLKGAGAITENEGKAATAAIARLDEAQSEDAYRAALKDLRTVVESGRNRLRLQTGKSQQEIDTTRGQLGPNAANAGGTVRKYNPATGKIE